VSPCRSPPRIRSAEGVGVHPPAFDGTITVVLGGTDFNVPVIAVDGEVHAQLPLTPGWQVVDPAEYGAPDPAQLMSPDGGFSSLLTGTENLEEGESVRGGVDNKEVLTEFTGEVDGADVQQVIPSADGESTFDATYLVSAEGELREADLTGVFYPGTDPMTYALTFEDYGTEKDVTAP
jgi:lipoprotein LprG